MTIHQTQGISFGHCGLTQNYIKKLKIMQLFQYKKGKNDNNHSKKSNEIAL